MPAILPRGLPFQWLESWSKYDDSEDGWNRRSILEMSAIASNLKGGFPLVSAARSAFLSDGLLKIATCHKARFWVISGVIHLTGVDWSCFDKSRWDETPDICHMPDDCTAMHFTGMSLGRGWYPCIHCTPICARVICLYSKSGSCSTFRLHCGLHFTLAHTWLLLLWSDLTPILFAAVCNYPNLDLTITTIGCKSHDFLF